MEGASTRHLVFISGFALRVACCWLRVQRCVKEKDGKGSGRTSVGGEAHVFRACGGGRVGRDVRCRRSRAGAGARATSARCDPETGQQGPPTRKFDLVLLGARLCRRPPSIPYGSAGRTRHPALHPALGKPASGAILAPEQSSVS